MRLERMSIVQVKQTSSARNSTVMLRSKRFTLLPLCVVISLLGTMRPAFSIAEQNTMVNLPADIRNAIVRIGVPLPNGVKEYGTGIVIRKKPDQNGTGGWLCVLTADHVVASKDSGWYIAFGDGDVPIGRLEDYEATIRIRHPVDALGRRVDLAILGVYVQDLTSIPNIPNNITIGAPPNENLVACGYGWAGTRPQNANYYVVTEEFGTFRNGTNTWENLNGTPLQWASSLQTYNFISLQFDLDFDQGGPNTGEAFVLTGDSGGPSLQFVNNAWVLTGIHSASQRLFDANNSGEEDTGDHARAGFLSVDVRLANYINWINASCAAVPEPFSLTALSAGLLGLLLKRRGAA